MNRLRIVLGFVAGAVLIASSGAHAFLGWPAVRLLLYRAQVPNDLLGGILVVWQFGGVAMLTFGCIVLWLFTNLINGRQVSLLPAMLIGLAYVAFGAWALAMGGMSPFFLLFIIPGLLLVAASALPVPRTPRSAPSAV